MKDFLSWTRKFVGAGILGLGLVAGLATPSFAQDYGWGGFYGGVQAYRPSYGYGYGHSAAPPRHFGYYGSVHSGHRHWHDTSHYDWHDTSHWDRHGNHSHYHRSGHWDYHPQGHWDYHR